MTLFVSIFLVHNVTAQTEKTYTLREICDLAIANSKQLQLSASAIETSQTASKLVKSALTPEIELSASASYIGNGVLTERNWSNAQDIEMPHFGNNFGFEATQVIFAGGSILKNVEKAKLQEQVAQLSHNRNELDICFLVTSYYLDIYKLRNQKEVFLKNIEQTEILIEQIKSKELQGMALGSDVTRHELMLQNLKLSLIEVENNLAIINYQMLVTLGLDSDIRIIPDASVLDVDLQNVDKDNLLQTASENLPELKVAALNKEIAAKEVRIAQSDYYPSLAAVATNHFDGPILVEVPTINSNFNYWYVGVGLKYNLSSIYKTNRKVQLAKSQQVLANYEEAVTKEHIDVAVHSAYTKFSEAFEKLSVYETSRRLADENYRIINNRYLNELVLITEMLDASNTKLNAELQVVNAKINVIYNYYKLQRELGTLAQ